MTRTTDVIIIGAGVIGAATAFELAKQGRKVTVVDRLTQAGHGSTAGSCAIIRMHYSTFDGTAFAWEGYHYWRDWADYLGAPAGEALAHFREVGCLVMKTQAN
ncbi:MAG: FAD-dependent oxidoreductase, partial [Pseudomonadota bacterium]